MAFILYTTLCILYLSMLVAAAPPVAATALAAISQIGSNTPPNYAFRLPAEVWFCIFGLVANEMRLINPLKRNSAYKHYPELLLSHICGRFRLIAYQMPWLWRIIPLHPLSFRDNAHLQHTIRILHKYVAHCGELLPLTIVVRDKFDSPMPLPQGSRRKSVKRAANPAWDRVWNRDRATGLVRTVLPVAHRWAALVARVEQSHAMGALVGTIATKSFALLADINLEVREPTTASHARECFIPASERVMGYSLPSLRSLTTRGIDFNAVQVGQTQSAFVLRISTYKHDSGSYENPRSKCDNLQSIVEGPANRLAHFTIDCEQSHYLVDVRGRNWRIDNKSVQCLTVSAIGLATVAAKINFVGVKRLVVIKVPNMLYLFRDLVLPDFVNAGLTLVLCPNVEELVIENRNRKGPWEDAWTMLFGRLNITTFTLSVAGRGGQPPIPHDGVFSYYMAVHLGSRQGMPFPSLRSLTVNVLGEHLEDMTTMLSGVMPGTFGRISRGANKALKRERGLSVTTRTIWSIVDSSLQ